MIGVVLMKCLSFLVLLIIVSLVLLSGCLGEGPGSSLPEEGTPVSDNSESFGLFNETSGSDLSDSNRMDLSYAFMSLMLSVSDGYLTGDNYSLRIIRGTNADIYGNCDAWVVGAVRDGEDILLKYTLSGWSEEPWPGVLRGDDINIDEIISPSELFENNSLLISGIIDNSVDPHMDLEISSGYYRILINDGGVLTALKFDSKTGDVI
ncbi:hypothetical protein [Methanoplanus endosymbiosus]|uniref:Uncharacterized protein n=1 Tax=Methanoplanus endosymbiosus TaxID=33865 RepID=A0A9E7TMS0_9EURY|nr:hypothetical protein [Methanoplanus endosymbiosus]UUX93601.1 hypothetical protein L6E24_05645 [Methanoplanus endosymbiosus]